MFKLFLFSFKMSFVKYLVYYLRYLCPCCLVQLLGGVFREELGSKFPIGRYFIHRQFSSVSRQLMLMIVRMVVMMMMMGVHTDVALHPFEAQNNYHNPKYDRSYQFENSDSYDIHCWDLLLEEPLLICINQQNLWKNYCHSKFASIFRVLVNSNYSIKHQFWTFVEIIIIKQ